MRVKKWILENRLTSILVIVYFGLFIFARQLAMKSIHNSMYFIKEMILIMPVIFILTALLDLWVPKNRIVEVLGKDSKMKGVFLSFVIGSMSCGPIYAAFPMCKMLHKKGASIRNIIIILSSWAVIKVPMLINELKFLGMKFMITRWILTVISIILFSYIASRVISEEDLPIEDEIKKEGLFVKQSQCIGCKICFNNHQDIFDFENKKARVKLDSKTLKPQTAITISKICPVDAIKYE
ncbi:MAG: permease [Tissierellia bacterium]|nr:permease [Tissierellia bacterium]